MRHIHPVRVSVAMAMLATSLAGCAVTADPAAITAYVDEATITAGVLAAIFEEPSLEKTPISVRTTTDVVLLNGYVDSYESRSLAAHLARNTPGVRLVHNELIVK